MKHLANYIKILPLTDYESFDGESLISKSGAAADLIIANNELVFNPLPESSGGGPRYSEELSVVTDKLSKSQREVYCSLRPVVVLLFEDTGTPIIWGDAEQKVRITLTPNTDRDILDLKRITTTPLF